MDGGKDGSKDNDGQNVTSRKKANNKENSSIMLPPFFLLFQMHICWYKLIVRSVVLELIYIWFFKFMCIWLECSFASFMEAPFIPFQCTDEWHVYYKDQMAMI
jgi:hypothetical protein